MEGQKYTVYVLENSYGQWYVGQTNNLGRRLKEHNHPEKVEYGSKWTKHRGPWKLIYYETFLLRADAMRREKYLKGGRGRAFLTHSCFF